MKKAGKNIEAEKETAPKVTYFTIPTMINKILKKKKKKILN